VCCSVLWFVAICQSVLQYVAEDLWSRFFYKTRYVNRLMQRVALCCTVLQFVREGLGSRSCAYKCHMRVAVCCSVSNVRCSVLQHVKRYVTVCCNMSIVCCRVLQYVAMRCSVLQSVKRALQCVAVCYNMLQCVTVRCRGFLLPLCAKRGMSNIAMCYIYVYIHTQTYQRI